MKLDLDKISQSRSRYTDFGDMGYLLSRIRTDILENISEQDAPLIDALVIDLPDPANQLESGMREKHPDIAITTLDWSCGIMAPYENAPYEESPYENASDLYDCIVVNLQLTWDDFTAAITALRDRLRPGGLLLFSCLGPDTLGEIADAWHGIDSYPHVFDFIDMHHLGDVLVREGFEKPIVSTDRVQVHYDSVDQLAADLRAEGLHNIRQDRRKTLTGKGRYQRFTETLVSAQTGRSGSVTITFEIIHGFAIRGKPSDGGIRVQGPMLQT